MAGRKIDLNPDGLKHKPDDEQPDSTFPYGPCPRCGRLSSFTPEDALPLTYDQALSYVDQSGRQVPDVKDRVAVLRCQGCREGVAVIEQRCTGGVPWREGSSRSGGLIQWQGLHWWPAPGMIDNDPDVPEAVRSAIAEGTRSLSVRAPRAAVVMFRGALAEIVSDRGSDQAKGRKALAAQLEQMSSDHVLEPTLAEWAKQVRVLGNAGAHPNELEPVSIADAQDLGALINSVVEYLYRVPARLTRSRTRKQP